MLKFKLWLENIKQPYYRIISPMHGSGAERNKIDNLGPGTYWTPRWDAVLFMLRSIFLHGMSIRQNWNVKVYELNNAVMENAPESHKWAFKYAHDAGEMVLVKALEAPKIVFDHNLQDPAFENIIDQSFQHKEPINHEAHGVKAIWRGDAVILSPNYEEKSLDVVQKVGWEFKVLLKITNSAQLSNFNKEAQIDWESDPNDSVSWFLHDMNWS